MFIIVNCTPKVRHKTFGVLYSSANEYYTQVPLYYAQVPSSTMLKCHRVLYSSAIEYYAHVPLSTMLMCH